MATEVAKLVARLEADVRDFERGMKRAEKRLEAVEKDIKGVGREQKKTARTTDGMTSGMKKFAAAAGIAFAAKQVFDFGRAAVMAASDLQESINAVNVTFGDAAEGILKIGEGAADALGLSNAEFNSLAVSFSAFAEQVAGPGGNVVSVIDDLTTRAADFASVMNLDVAEAATIFRSALAGETEAIRRFGVDVSAAAVNTKALELGLAGSSAELTEQDKILARYQLIMEQTEKTQGDFANTSDSFANGMRRLGAAFEDAKAELGEQLLPVLEALIPVGLKIVEFIGDLALEFGNLIGVVSDAEVAVRKAKLGLDDNADATDHVAAALKRLSVNMELVEGDTKEAGDELDQNAEIVRQLTDEYDDLRGEFNLTADDLINLKTNSKELADEYGISVDAVEAFIAALEEQNTVTIDLTDEQKAAQKAFNEAQDAQEAAERGTDAFSTAARRAKARTDDYIDSIGGLETGMDTLGDEVERALQKMINFDRHVRAATDPVFAITAALGDYEQAQQDLAAVTDKTSPEAVAAFQDQADALGRLLTAVKELGGNWEAEFRAIAESMGAPQELVDALIAKVNEGVDTSWKITLEILPELVGSLPQLGIAGGDIPSIDTSDTTFDFNIEGFAQHGGPVSGPMVVGEAGRELFIPSTPGTILSHSETEAALRMGGDELHFHFSGPVGSQAELQQWVQEAIEETRRINAS